jgi:hypothetical protein
VTIRTCHTCGEKFEVRLGSVNARCHNCVWAGDRARQPAARAVTRAIKSGELLRQPCEVCGDPRSDAHHDDYSKPLDVRWLCRSHHRQHHIAQERAMRAAMNSRD